MAYRTRNSSRSSRKAQFFILSVFAIIGILYFVSRWFQPTTILDTSSIASMDEPFIFNNIRENVFTVVNGSESCQDIKFNMEEFKNYAEYYGVRKNLKLVFDYDASPCFPPIFPIVVATRLSISSTSFSVNSNFDIVCDNLNDCRFS